jgi:tripartite-type tricarboxylate transporter receptor subunit TctC
MRYTIFVWSLFFCLRASEAAAQTPYFQNKTIKIIRGGTPGGTGDLQARALIPFLRKYIPGEPTIIVENMPGAAGRKAANYIFSSAKPDGLSIGAVGAGLVVGPILDLPGSRYDLEKLIYLGSTESGDPYVFVSRKDAALTPSINSAPRAACESVRKPSGIQFLLPAAYSPIYWDSRIRRWWSATVGRKSISH